MSFALGSILSSISPHIIITSIICIYLGYVYYRRYEKVSELDRLDPKKPLTLQQAFNIFYTFGTIEFPFLNTKSLEFALFKTYSIPSISAILVKSGEMAQNMPKRYDDTDLLIREFTEHPPNSQRANLAIQLLNFLHGHYPISNNDYLYTLSVFIVEPVVWVNQYGYRNVHLKEKESLYMIWSDIGKKMGIKNIPESWDGVYTWMRNYEGTRMKYHHSNSVIANATMNLFLSILPTFLRPFGYSLIVAFCSPSLRKAMGFPEPPFGAAACISLVMTIHSGFVRFLALPRAKPLVRTPSILSSSDTPDDNRTGVGCPLFHPYSPTYKDGYRIDELGPITYKEKREISPLYPQLK